MPEPSGGRPRLGIVYGGGSSSPMDLAAATDGYCDIVWIVEAGDPTLGSLWQLLPRLGTVVDVADLSLQEIAARLFDEGVGGVVAFSDAQLEMAALLGAACGLPQNPLAVVERLTDKYLQRETLREAGLPTPRFVLVEAQTPEEKLRELVEPMRFPVVLKPTHGTGSRSTFRVEDCATLVGLVASLPTSQDERDGFLVEEYLADRVPPGEQSLGDYVSVEMIVADGDPVPLAVTGKFPLAAPFRETGNFMPSALVEAEELEVRELAVRASTALGVRFGALHVEIKLTPSGPCVIEVNGRVGGGAIDGIYQLACGGSLTRLAVRTALGHRVSDDAMPDVPREPSHGFVYAFFLQAPLGVHRIEGIEGLDEVRSLPGFSKIDIEKSPGDAIDWRVGSLDYVLSVQGRAEDEARLRGVPKSICTTLRIAYQ